MCRKPVLGTGYCRGSGHCQSMFTMSYVAITCAIVLSSVVTAQTNFTTIQNNFTTTITTQMPDDGCHDNCRTCDSTEPNMCTSCNEKMLLVLPDKNCSKLLEQCSNYVYNIECTLKCEHDENSCQCVLETVECEDCILGMTGTCEQDCPPNTQSKDNYFIISNDTSVCSICDDLLFGTYCIDRYLVWIVVIPVAIFILLLLLVIFVIFMCLRRHGKRRRDNGPNLNKKRDTIPIGRAPEPLPQDYPSMRRNTNSSATSDDFDGTNAIPLQMRNISEEPTQDDIYGNVDDQNNVMLNQAPIADQQQSMKMNRRGKLNLPPFHGNHSNESQDLDVAEAEDTIYDNDSVQGPAPGYVHMQGNVHVETPRYPQDHPHSPPLQSPEPTQDSYYGNVNPTGIHRHGTTPVRRPPSIPTKKTASTFPHGLDPSFGGQINQGYDDEGTDDYPDLSQQLNHDMPSDRAPPPPWQQNRQDSVPAYPAPPPPDDNMDSLPSLPPPAPPTNKPRKPKPTKTIPSNVGQQSVNSRIPQHNLPTDDMPQSPISDLQKQLQQSLHSRGGASDKPPPGGPTSKPTPALPRPRVVRHDSDSDESQDEYEIVENPDENEAPSPPRHDDIGGRRPNPTPHRDPANRLPLAPPTGRKKPPPIPSMKPPKSQDIQQEVYEVVEDASDTKDRPRLPVPGEPVSDEFYEPVEVGNTDEVYEITDDTGRYPPQDMPRKPIIELEEDDIYQNEPVMKHPKNSGRYRNLPADRGTPAVGKEGPYTRWHKH